MKHISIWGGNSLYGEIDVQGSKNAALPILAATLLNSGESVIKNCPDIEDVRCAIDILKFLGCETTFSENTITVNSENAEYKEIPNDLVCKMRSSVLFSGALLARFKKCVLKNPGGCNIGARPVDMHINAFKILGATEVLKDDCLEMSLGKLNSAPLKLPYPSVGVTENIMFLGASACCDLVVENAAKEPEIADLAKFLNSMGAKIYGAGTSVLRILGAEKLNKVNHTVIPDRVATCTYLFGALSAGGEIVLNNTDASHILSVLEIMKQMGTDILCEKDRISVKCGGKIKSVNITADVYPYFPTDVQPIASACLCRAEGTSVISDSVFPERFSYADELIKMGADISRGGYGIKIRGRNILKGAEVFAKDLRAGAALVVAALGAEGNTKIFDVSHILRGYRDITGDFEKLGGKIKLVSYEKDNKN